MSLGVESEPEDQPETNGTRWLWELVNGAEKAFRLNTGTLRTTGLSYLQPVQGRVARRLFRRSDGNLLTKIRRSEDALDQLVGSAAVVTPLEGSDFTEALEGRLTAYDLDEASIRLKGAGRLAVIRYCEHQFAEGGEFLTKATFIELQTDTPHPY